jgi:hypothetical protein
VAKEIVTHEDLMVEDDHSRANYVDDDGNKYHVSKTKMKFGPTRHLDADGNELLDSQKRPLKVLDRGICTNVSMGGDDAKRKQLKKFQAKAFKDSLTRENRSKAVANLDRQAGKQGFGRKGNVNA